MQPLLRTALLAIAAVVSLTCAPARAFTSVRDVVTLPREVARGEHPVEVRAVVTTVVSGKNALCIQDDTGGVYVNAARAIPSACSASCSRA